MRKTRREKEKKEGECVGMKGREFWRERKINDEGRESICTSHFQKRNQRRKRERNQRGKKEIRIGIK